MKKEEREFLGFQCERGAKQKLRVLAAHEGIPMSEFLRKIVEARVRARKLDKIVEGMAR